ncbi:MAG: hypothetical protein ACR2N3_15310 [Pyrinomonadaceae bacterium]
MADKIKYSTTGQTANSGAVNQEDFEEELLEHAVLRLNGSVLGIVLGIVAGLLIFVATNWLVIKGGSNVGSHLNLLSQFFTGYSVTFVGSLIGLFYGFLTGFISGFLIAWIYNRIIILKKHSPKI